MFHLSPAMNLILGFPVLELLTLRCARLMSGKKALRWLKDDHKDAVSRGDGGSRGEGQLLKTPCPGERHVAGKGVSRGTGVSRGGRCPGEKGVPGRELSRGEGGTGEKRVPGRGVYRGESVSRGDGCPGEKRVQWRGLIALVCSTPRGRNKWK